MQQRMDGTKEGLSPGGIEHDEGDSPRRPQAIGESAPVGTDRAAMETVGVSKAYGAVRALADVSITVRRGEIVALVGDNGAGKSTLVGVLAGAVWPDSGQLRLHGEQVAFRSPNDSRRAGVGVVYQDLALAPHLSVARNLFMGMEPRCRGLRGRVGRLIDFAAMERETQAAVTKLLRNIPDSRVAVGRLSGGQRQAIAIARAVLWSSGCLILDEPTAALGIAESRRVIELVSELRAHNLAILMVSHSLPDVMAISDRIAVMRRGHLVSELTTADVSGNDVVAHITGVGI